MAEHSRPTIPTELLPRILACVAIISPPLYLNCLLTCKTWNGALTFRERGLVKYNFLDVDDLPEGMITYIEEPWDMDQEPVLDAAKYFIAQPAPGVLALRVRLLA